MVESVRDRADVVLLDAPPLLPVSDGIALSAYVDAFVLIRRLGTLRSFALEDLRRIVGSSSAQKAGFVVTGTKTGIQTGSRLAMPRPSDAMTLAFRVVLPRSRAADLPSVRVNRKA